MIHIIFVLCIILFSHFQARLCLCLHTGLPQQAYVGMGQTAAKAVAETSDQWILAHQKECYVLY